MTHVFFPFDMYSLQCTDCACICSAFPDTFPPIHFHHYLFLYHDRNVFKIGALMLIIYIPYYCIDKQQANFMTHATSHYHRDAVGRAADRQSDHRTVKSENNDRSQIYTT